MAELFDHGNTYSFDPTCYIGTRGDVVIPVSDVNEDGESNLFITLSAFEAKTLIKELTAAIDDYKKQLNVA